MVEHKVRRRILDQSRKALFVLLDVQGAIITQRQRFSRQFEQAGFRRHGEIGGTELHPHVFCPGGNVLSHSRRRFFNRTS
ncbi:hypothetical protein ACFFX0_32890 [Citricoccus parietis]|uniref:Isochorismatase-like domain-containing protein n=1 Tax=Citricoccus parietis TaxID=592307 RepID=A0ABV5G8F8_9MICC